MKRLGLLAAICATSCLTGCFTLEHATLSDGREHVWAYNYGWTLFNWIPLVSGNASKDPTCDFVIFRDDVTMEKVHARFNDYAGGRQVETPVFVNYDTKVFRLFGIPFPYIICYKEVSLSGTCK